MGWGGDGKGKVHGAYVQQSYDDGYGAGHDGGWGGGGGWEGGYGSSSYDDGKSHMWGEFMKFVAAKGKGKSKSRSKGKGGGGGGGGSGQSESLKKLKQIECDRKVFVNGLPDGATSKDLASHFEERVSKPEVTELLSSSTACLAFATADQAMQAAAELGGSELSNSMLQVELWTDEHDEHLKDKNVGGRNEPQGEKRKKPPSESFDFSKQKNLARKNAAKVNAVEDNLKVLISGLALTAHWKELKMLCTDSGVEPEMVVIHEPGAGVVTFPTPSDAVDAIAKLTGSTLGGNEVTASAWENMEVDAKKVKVL